MIDKKYCSNPNCEQVNPQPLSEFYKNKAALDGLFTRCKSCSKRERKEYYKLHADEFRENARRFRQTNPEKAREWKRHYREANREKVREANRKYQQANKDKVNKRKRPSIYNDKARERIRRRNERVRKNGGDYSGREWMALCDYYNNKCLACGEEKELTPDHIIPVSKGGGSDLSNIQPLCMLCNLKKGVQIIDYRPTIPRWAK